MSEGKHTLAQSRDRIAVLEKIVRDTLWMARRYAHGRQSYAVGMYNEAARAALAIGLKLDAPDGSLFAIDGMDDGAGRSVYSGLSPDEFSAAVEGLNAVGITPHPGRFTKAARATQDPDTTAHVAERSGS